MTTEMDEQAEDQGAHWDGWMPGEHTSADRGDQVGRKGFRLRRFASVSPNHQCSEHSDQNVSLPSAATPKPQSVKCSSQRHQIYSQSYYRSHSVRVTGQFRMRRSTALSFINDHPHSHSQHTDRHGTLSPTQLHNHMAHQRSDLHGTPDK